MSKKAVVFAVWVAISTPLIAIVKETIWSAFTDYIIKAIGFSEGAEMIAAAASYVLPAGLVALAMWGTYLITIKTRPVLSTGVIDALPSEWVHPSTAVDRFADPELIKKRDVAEVAFKKTWDTTQYTRDEVIMATHEYEIATHIAKNNIPPKLADGTLVAKGMPVVNGVPQPERSIPIYEWRILRLNLEDAKAFGEGLEYVGVQIGKPN